jgi:FkbM family methyltransferase
VGIANRTRALATSVSRRLPHFRGKTRVLRALDRYLRNVSADRQQLCLTVDGVAFALNTEDLIDFRIAYLAEHDSAVTRCLDGIIRGRLAVLWDVGANIGAISLPLARRHSGVVIEAFEPSPGVAARLRRNLALNASLDTRVRVHEIALCDRTGSVEFFPSAEPENSGVGTMMPCANTEATPVRVAAQTGDLLIETGAARPPDVIKIDVEGFEYEVLDGLREHLERHRDVAIVFEHEPYRLRDRKEARSATELLTSLGFTLFGLPQHGMAPVPFRPTMLEDHIDILARRPHATPATLEAEP